MIRAATLEDVPRIVEMGQRFRELIYRDLLADNPVQMRAISERLISGDDSVILVVEKFDRVIGMIGMMLFDHFLSAERVAGEVAWWIEPEDRGDGLRLLLAAETWARDNGAQKIQMIAPNERVGKLYRRLGYMPIETAYQKAL